MENHDDKTCGYGYIIFKGRFNGKDGLRIMALRWHYILLWRVIVELAYFHCPLLAVTRYPANYYILYIIILCFQINSFDVARIRAIFALISNSYLFVHSKCTSNNILYTIQYILSIIVSFVSSKLIIQFRLYDVCSKSSTGQTLLQYYRPPMSLD